MYIHCHACGWEQDDFWSKSYNPIQFLQSYERDLLDFSRLDQVIPAQDHEPETTNRKRVLKALRRAIHKVEEMHFLLPPKGSAACPRCGKEGLDVD